MPSAEYLTNLELALVKKDGAGLGYALQGYLEATAFDVDDPELARAIRAAQMTLEDLDTILERRRDEHGFSDLDRVDLKAAGRPAP